MKFLDLFNQFRPKRANHALRVDEDSLDPIGNPVIIVRDRDGNIVQEIKRKNLVVTTGRNALLAYLMGDYTKTLTKVELGSGGVLEASPFAPLPVSASDTVLAAPFSPVVEKAISGKSYDAGTYPVKGYFSVIFDSSEVDKIVSEASLKFSDNRMYARFTFPSVYLKADKGYSLEIIWSSAFTS